jgi:aldehyde:ferredoxin oxidoreductase
MGTTKLVHALNEAGCLATRHFQTGRFEKAEDVSGEYLAEIYKKKSKGCFACTIPCSRFYEIHSGDYKGLKSEGPEFEGLAGFSSRVGVGEIEPALKGVDLCNRYGMDVISTSECISFAMELFEKGIITKQDTDDMDLSWGNSKSVLELITKIAYRKGFGHVLADGVVKAAERIGLGSEKYAMHVKKLEIFQADPRGLKGYALGVAVASRGGDHLRSEPSFEFTEDADEGIRRFGVAESAFRLEYKGKGKVVKFYEERSALADCLDVCKNTITNMEILPFEQAAEILTALTGYDFTSDELKKSAERVVNLERVYICRCGMGRVDDTLPERFLHEPLPKECGQSAGSVVELEPMLDEYYHSRGWDVKTGVPTKEKLEELNLDEIISDLYSNKG